MIEKFLLNNGPSENDEILKTIGKTQLNSEKKSLGRTTGLKWGDLLWTYLLSVDAIGIFCGSYEEEVRICFKSESTKIGITNYYKGF